MKKIILGLCAAFFASCATAVSVKPPLCIEARTDDSIGNVLYYRLASEIRNAGVFTLVDNCSDALAYVVLTSIDVDKGSTDLAGYRTFFSYVINIRMEKVGAFSYLMSFVSYCGRDVTSNCAVQLAQATDSQLKTFKSILESRQSKK